VQPRTYYVYALSNERRNVLYVGVTNDLARRLSERRAGLVPGFTARYHVHDLVWYEATNDIYAALKREKQLKGWRREWKWALVKEVNPTYADLSDRLTPL